MKTFNMITMIAAAFMLLSLNSCTKNETSDSMYYTNSNNNTTITSFIDALFENNKPEAQQFTIGSSWTNITGEQGTKIYFPTDRFVDQNGQTVSGNVDIELIEVYSKKDMILSNMHTLACNDINNTQDDQLLISGGEFSIKAFQNGEELKLKQGASLYVEIPTTSNSPTDYKVFYADMSNENFPSWEEDDNPVTLTIDSFGIYVNGFQVDSLDWTNLDKYFSTNSSNPNMATFKLPSQFDDSNTKVYISLSNYNSIANAYYASPDFTSGSGYTLPVGTEVTIVAIADINGDVYTSFTPTTITQNHVETLNMSITSEQDLIDQLSNM